MNTELELQERIQSWVDNRFGPNNTFNIQLLMDFLEFCKAELGYTRQYEPPMDKVEAVEKILYKNFDCRCLRETEDGGIEPVDLAGRVACEILKLCQSKPFHGTVKTHKG